MNLKEFLPVYEKDGFRFFKEKRHTIGDLIIMDTSRTELTLKYMVSNQLKGMMINSSYFPVGNLAFLKDFKFLESIFVADDKQDMTVINTLQNLIELTLTGDAGVLDFKNFPNLESLSITYSNRILNFNSIRNIKWLRIDNYKKTDLEEFKELQKLSYLYLYRPSVKNLNGIENLTSLGEINIDTAISLNDISALNPTMNNLECLYIYSAKKLHDYKPVSNLTALKQLELRRTGETESIDFIKELGNLQTVVLGFKVLNGDMRYLKDIKKVGFIDFSHYSHKMKDFNRGV